MRTLEFEAKKLLAEQDLPVPRGRVAATATDALAAARALGCPVVIKAQIPTGGRMKAGGVLFADTPDLAAFAADALIGKEIRGFTIDQLLVEERLEIDFEMYVGITYDADAREAAILASISGGIDVETIHQIVRRPFSCVSAPGDYVGIEVASRLGFCGRLAVQLGRLIARLVRCFLEWDASLLEINPLVLDTDGQVWIADVHLELDQNAAGRQRELRSHLTGSARYSQKQTDFEQRALEINQADHRGVAGRLVPFGGELGLLIGGGGASLTAFDAVLDAGLKPANYCEIGGNPSVWKIQELTKLILSQPKVKRLAVIMNVVSNTRVDLVARGVIKGVLELGQDPKKVIAAFRIPGSWEDEGEAILNHFGIRYFRRETSIDQVVEAIKWQS